MNQHQIIASSTGIVVKIAVSVGDQFKQGQELVVLEAMKMESAIVAPSAGKVDELFVEEGMMIDKGRVLIRFSEHYEDPGQKNEDPDQTQIHPNHLEELRQRKQLLTDEARPEAVTKRNVKNQNTARKNIELLLDEDSFCEYGGHIVAAQRTRRSEEDLIKNTPADGLIAGTGTINSELHPERAGCMVMAYDYTVLAGTQGTMNHLKMDRMLDLARQMKIPVILFAEGGGGRPGDVDVQTIAGLFINTFTEFAGLRGHVPTISIVNGYCFAGNAALAGSSDIIIATKNSSLGMGGPAMIEGGGLGKVKPQEVGPSDIQFRNGVIDLLVENETEAVALTKKYLSFYQGKTDKWQKEDQASLQHFVPDNRKRTFDIRALISILFDQDSLIEFKSAYASGLVTLMGRIEGNPVGIIANDSKIDAGAITAVNAQKAAQFLDLCNRIKLPVVSLVDTPGIMVGPEAEKEGTVRAAGNLFVTGACFQQPILAIVLRRAYGLGAMAMMGGSTRRPVATVSWPTGEFGAMGLEGAVRLGFRKELEAVEDPSDREALFQKMVEEAYKRGKALSMATMFEIDDVIEPRDTRKWIMNALFL